ncbi:hypothetical protein KIN20_037748 [Parelaphostrongylus tenuis]|uniref:Uncharacterized protein n=1 Tax=Parelaphostrongylus tenuis TaxID=148309 RepID=A0AAD5WM80_PARTN|nr:hypothetical protein KIN20_037748 [Parelaphostrongylus tenuis]
MSTKNTIGLAEYLHASKIVHDLEEQVVLQRLEDHRQKSGPIGDGGTQLPPTSTVSSIAGHHPNSRFTSSEPPHLKS